MSYEKDKELMQEIHNLIEDYNYLKKVIPIIKNSYIEERKNFYINNYQDCADILEYQLKSINKIYNSDITIKNIFNIDNFKKKIENTIKFNQSNLGEIYYYGFNDKFRIFLLEVDKKIKENIEQVNYTIQIIKKPSNIDNNFLDLSLLNNPEKILEIEKTNIDEDFKVILTKIKNLNSIKFNNKDSSFNTYLNFYNYDFFKLVKNKLYNENVIEEYEFNKEEIINLIGLNFGKKYNTYPMDNFFMEGWGGINKNLENYKKYIETIFNKNFDKLFIKGKNAHNLLFENNYLFLFFFDDFETFNFKVFLYILKWLNAEKLLNFYNNLPQKYKDLFNEKIVSKFDKEEINPFKKLQLNNKLNKNIISLFHNSKNY